MSIISKIKTSVEDATGLQLHYYDESMINQIIDNNPLPCAFFYLLKDTEVLTDSAQNTERANVAIFFVNKTEFDFNSFENEEIISACKQNADGWLRSLMTSGQLKITDGTTIRSTRIYNEFDCILTGIAYNITLEEVYGFNACKDMPYIPPRIITITENGEYDIEAFTKAIVNNPDATIGKSIRDNNDYKAKYENIVSSLAVKYPNIVGWLYCQTSCYDRGEYLRTTLILQGADSYWIDNEHIYAYENGDTENPLTYIEEDGTTYVGTRNYTVKNQYAIHDVFYGYLAETTSDCIRSAERRIYCHYCSDAIIPIVRTENTNYVYGAIELYFKEGYTNASIRMLYVNSVYFKTNATLLNYTELPTGSQGVKYVIGNSSCLLFVDAPNLEEYRYGSLLADNKTITRISLPKLRHLGAYPSFVSNGYMALCFNCTQLQDLHLTSLESIDMQGLRGAIARDCNSLKKLYLPALKETTNPAGDGNVIVAYCANLEEINLPALVVFNAQGGLFSACPKLRNINMPSLKTVYLTGGNYESFINFSSNDTLIEEINLPSFESGNMDYHKYLVKNCSKLKRVILPSIKSYPATISWYNTTPLSSCPNVEYIYLGCKGDTSQTVGFGSSTELTNCTDLEIGESARQNIVITMGINNLTRDNIVNHIFNRLADNTGGSALRIRLGATNLSRLSEADKEIAINKNYTLA